MIGPCSDVSLYPLPSFSMASSQGTRDVNVWTDRVEQCVGEWREYDPDPWNRKLSAIVLSNFQHSTVTMIR
jgi:hypothetical protein